MEREQTENIMGTMPEGRLLFKLAMPMIFGMNQVLIGLSLAAPAVYVIYNRVRSFVALPGVLLRIFSASEENRLLFHASQSMM